MRALVLALSFVILASAAAKAGEPAGGALDAKDDDQVIALMNQKLNDPGLSDDDKALAHAARGSAYLLAGRLTEGIDDLTYALAHEAALKSEGPSAVAQVHYFRGLAYQAAGENDTALADFKTAIRLESDDSNIAEYYQACGDAYYALGKSDDAIASYGESLKRNADNADVLINRGENYENQKLFDKAIADYSAALRVDPADAMAYNDRGTALAGLSRAQEAMADYTKAIALDAASSLYLRNRADLHNSLGEYQRAIDDLNTALTLDNDADAKKAIADAMKTAQDGLAKKKP